MFFKLFSKSPAARPRTQETATPAAELDRRIKAIEFKPSKGFLKDRPQPRRLPRSV